MTLTYTALVHRITLTILVWSACAQACGAVQPTSAAPLPPPARALVYVPETGDSTRIEALGLPIYARLDGRDGPYLLVGADPGAATGALSGTRTGRPGTTGGGWADRPCPGPRHDRRDVLLGLPCAGPANPTLEGIRSLLLDDGQAVLLRAAPSDAERLAADGADIVLVTLTPKPLRPVAAASFPPVTVADPLVRSMIDQVSQTKLEQYVRELSGESAVIMGGETYTIVTRHTESGTPIQKATQYVGEHLTGLGLTVEDHPWSWTNSTTSYSGHNVIGQITGETTPDQIFLIGAHLDDMPPGASAPGADDNASGSAAVLVAADILSQYRWGCTLRFALWTGEEQGLLGSAAYAQRSFNRSEDIAGVLNLDMIAWNTAGSTPDIDLHAKSALPATLDLANQFSSVVTAYNLNLTPQVVAAGSGASDHASFWNQGYTAILGIEDYYLNRPDFNPKYHTIDDQVEQFDMGYFTDFVKASVGAFAHMSGCLLSDNPKKDVTYLPLITSGTALQPGGTPTYTMPRAQEPYFAPTPDNQRVNR